mmetsp:Transcript_48198/g.112776  ORF Transcript_48198/g.112776 Transcript_48198/m.112776 type:complete len:204 (-) Transcript_48198:1022-1633(-)
MLWKFTSLEALFFTKYQANHWKYSCMSTPLNSSAFRLTLSFTRLLKSWAVWSQNHTGGFSMCISGSFRSESTACVPPPKLNAFPLAPGNGSVDVDGAGWAAAAGMAAAGVGTGSVGARTSGTSLGGGGGPGGMVVVGAAAARGGGSRGGGCRGTAVASGTEVDGGGGAVVGGAGAAVGGPGGGPPVGGGGITTTEGTGGKITP